MKKKIIAFAGSNSSTSINKQLITFVLNYFPDTDVNLLDLNDFEMPIYSADREKNNGIPEKAVLFEEHIKNADAIVCSLAENNLSYSAAFKNILDWSSRHDSNVFAKKPMLLLSTSPGGYGGGNVMNAAKQAFPKLGADIIETFSLPSFNNTFQQQDIVDTDLKTTLLSKIVLFKKHIDA